MEIRGNWSGIEGCERGRFKVQGFKEGRGGSEKRVDRRVRESVILSFEEDGFEGVKDDEKVVFERD
ncbi:MAG: hypothetical protein HY769_09800 [Candidatus Stahlbacteria bacterium]|nr:hypothetical protein [Candidatus Stahlbacteria bacterium]